MHGQQNIKKKHLVLQCRLHNNIFNTDLKVEDTLKLAVTVCVLVSSSRMEFKTKDWYAVKAYTLVFSVLQHMY